jgi:hypothetical protein
MLDGTARMTIRTTTNTTILIMGLFSFLFGCSKQDTATTFPSDENGDILRQMAAQGDDFSKPRDINFSFVFPTESDGKAFVEQVQAMPGLKAEGPSFPDELKKWDTTVTKNMLPTHQDITALEQSLSRIAESHSGKADGWGCFVVKKSK